MGRAVVVHETGGPEVLRLEEHDPGEPGPGQVRVRVAAAGLNFIDVYFRTGLYPRPLPFVAGLEGAGVIERVGEGVAGFRAGDRVAWASVPGSYPDPVVGPPALLRPVRRPRARPAGAPRARAGGRGRRDRGRRDAAGHDGALPGARHARDASRRHRPRGSRRGGDGGETS